MVAARATWLLGCPVRLTPRGRSPGRYQLPELDGQPSTARLNSRSVLSMALPCLRCMCSVG